LAAQKFHTTNIPINTFNKVWIVPQKAVVYENSEKHTAYILESKLKVMLEEDYLSLQKHQTFKGSNINGLGSQAVREIVIPELTREVNQGRYFANLRQITNSLILAAWFKRRLREIILSKVYVDQKKTLGIVLDDDTITEKIYQQYLRAYKKGVYNYIKEEEDPLTHEIVPRKYFSGGWEGHFDPATLITTNSANAAQLSAEASDRDVTFSFSGNGQQPSIKNSWNTSRAMNSPQESPIWTREENIGNFDKLLRQQAGLLEAKKVFGEYYNEIDTGENAGLNWTIVPGAGNFRGLSAKTLTGPMTVETIKLRRVNLIRTAVKRLISFSFDLPYESP